MTKRHTPAERLVLFRSIVLWIGLYVTLDFVSPTMPGAVQLVDGAVQSVAACHERTVERPSQGLTPLLRTRSPLRREQEPVLAMCRPVVPPPRPPVLIRLAFEGSTPASSADDV